MLRFLAFALLVGYTLAVSSTFTWKDCAKDATRAVVLSGVTLSPTPLVLPGKLTLSFNATLNKPLSNVNLVLEVQKNLGFFGLVKVPCVGNVGSCIYDGCSKVAELKQYLDATDNDIYKQIYDLLKDNHFNFFKCPIPAPQTGSVVNFQFDIPTPSKTFDWLVNGDYHIVGRIQDKVSKVDYGCVDVNLGIMRGTA